jgi:hypothetical protein
MTPKEPRSWPIKATAWLLFGQAVALLALGVLNLLDLGVGASLTQDEALDVFVKGLTGGIVFIALACIGLVAVFNFWRVDKIAWTMGMMAQGLMLLTALIIYFEKGADIYAYVMMAYGIFMVIYLHLPDVVGTFRQINEENQ